MLYNLAVIGNPIEHSLSPTIFTLFAKDSNINLTYNKILANDKDDFKNKVTDFFNNNGFMLNITSPFKHEAYNIAQISSDLSLQTQTANTLYLKNNQLYADITDGNGLSNDLIINNNIQLLNKNILILGSGFVIESIIISLLGYNVKKIDILARNHTRIDYLINKYNNLSLYNNEILYDIIINTTPNTENNYLLKILIDNIAYKSLIYDITYNNNNYLQNLIKKKSNLIYLNGIGMLLEQARINFINLFNIIPNLTLEQLKSFCHNFSPL